MKDGTVTLLTRDPNTDELNIINFDKQGEAKVEGVFEAFEENITYSLERPAINVTLSYSSKILVSRMPFFSKFLVFVEN